MMNADELLLAKIQVAVTTANEAEKNVTVAQTELVSRSKAVGLLLLEAKKRHPKVADFEFFLRNVEGLKLSRAYDLLRLAGGRATDEELREEARNRKRKSRDRQKEQKRKLPKPEPKPEPISVTHPHVTESAEVSIERRREQNAALDADLSIPPFLDRTAAEQPTSGDHDQERKSRRALVEFRLACQNFLPLLNEADWIEAVSFFDDCVEGRKRRAA